MVREMAVFLGELLRVPAGVAAIAPSSAATAQRMTLGLEDATGPIVEIGPGTGSFTRAILAGIGIALVTGPLGCFIVWRRMAYFGDTMSHSALLGIALALLADLHPMAGVFAVVAAKGAA